jgi:5'-3' exonuclease
MAKTFKSMGELNPRVLIIVDSLNLAFRWKHKGSLVFADEYLQTVDSLRRSYSAGKVIITADGGSSSYRKELLPSYKGNREELRANQTPEDEKLFELFLKEFEVTLEKYRENTMFPVLKYRKVEADDIAAFIVKYRKKYNIERIVLISSDRDWDLLVDDDVMRFSYVTRKEISAYNWHEHYDYTQEQHISIKCLTGDSGDNVPGVDKIGPVTAKKLVDMYESTYDIIANLPLPGKYKYIQNLNAFGADALMLNYKLMDLLEHCEEAIGEDNCANLRETLGLYLND